VTGACALCGDRPWGKRYLCGRCKRAIDRESTFVSFSADVSYLRARRDMSSMSKRQQRAVVRG
jgi:hypothetical protein